MFTIEECIIMRYLHICMPSKRMMNTFISMMRKFRPSDEHRFLLWDRCLGADQILYEYGNIAELNKNSRLENFKLMKKEMKKADVIVWHGLICSGAQTLFLYLHPSFLKKTIWIIHGIDLMNYLRKDKSLKSFVINRLSNSIRRRIPNVFCLTPEDR